jgi:CHAT domain-containing protein
MVWACGLLLLAGCQRGDPGPRAQLAAALGSFRATEGRLTGGFLPAPLAPLGAKPPGGRELQRVVGRIYRTLAAKPGAEAWADAAALKLAVGDPDSAIALLTAATQVAPERGVLWSDLAVAYLERARRRGEPAALIRALSAADRAVAADPRLPEARFNQALALERLFLSRQAKDAWEEYGKLDPRSEWAEEARRHREALSQVAAEPGWKTRPPVLEQAAWRGDTRTVEQIVAEFPQQARKHAEDVLLADWAAEQAGGRLSAAARSLATARGIGLALAVRGDHMAADSVAVIDAALRETGGGRLLRCLVAGHQAYGRGLRCYREGAAAEADRAFLESSTALAVAGSPFAGWAAFQRAFCLYERNEYGPAASVLREWLGRIDARRHPALAGRCLRVLGLTREIAGRSTEAIDLFSRALPLFQAIGERESVAALDSLLGEAYGLLGETTRSWQFQYEALSMLGGRGEAGRSYTIWEQGALAALKLEQPAAALHFEEEWVRSARAAGDAPALAEALRQRALNCHQLGDRRAALADLEEGTRVLRAIPDERSRETVEGDLLLARGKVEQGTPAAVDTLDRALALARETAYGGRLAEIHFELARACRSLGRDDLAEQNLLAAIEDREASRRSIAAATTRIAFFDQTRALFNEMIAVQVERRKDPAASFDYSERGRSRALLDWISRFPEAAERCHGCPLAVGEPMHARDVQRALPRDVALVEYAALEGRLLVWAVRSTGIVLEQVSVGEPQLATRVARLRSALDQGRTTESLRALSGLYEILVAPVEKHVASASYVIFVPDASLQAVPFAALLAPRSHRYLIEDHAVAVAPSATVFVQSMRRDEGRSRRPEPSLWAALSPAFSHRDFPQLQELPAANREEADLRALFPHGDFRVGTAATAESFLAEAGGHEIIHFSGHSLADLESPFLSMLLFSPSGEQRRTGALYAHELLGQHFDRTRVAVLAACGTAIGSGGGREGATGLADSFLAAGVPAVVASLWNVEDEAARRLLAYFYERLEAGDNVLDALRASQLDLMGKVDAETRSPTAWAAFEIFGGSKVP